MNKTIIKICFVHHGTVLGGAPVSLLTLIKSLVKTKKYRFTLWCINEKVGRYFRDSAGIECEIVQPAGLILGRVLIGYSHLYNLKTFLLCALDILRLPHSIFVQYRAFKAEVPHIVHLNSSILVVTAIAAKLACCRVVWHIRETIVGGEFNLRRRFACHLITMLADKILAISPFEASRFFDQSKIIVVYNAVDLTEFNPDLYKITDAKRLMGFSPNSKVVVSLGGASFRKGTVQLIKAASMLEPNSCMVVAGQAPMLPAGRGISRFTKLLLDFEDILMLCGLKDVYSWYYSERICLALSENTNANIRFIGEVHNVPLLLAASDILVFAGTTPHFPRPVYEAWCMKKPVIALDVENIRQNIESGKDALLVPGQNATGLAAAISKLLNDAKLAGFLASNGFKKAVKVFDIDKTAEQVASVYSSQLP